MTSQFKLKGPVSATHDVDPSDSRKLNQALARLGFRNPRDGGQAEFIDGPALAGIKAFQRQSGLEPDGVVKPGGPSERLIAAALTERSGGSGQAIFALSRSVGERGVNQPGDIRRVKQALALAGYYPNEKARDPSARVDDDLELGIRPFQRDFNLKRDGLLRPDGKTEQTLARVVKPAAPAERELAGAASARLRRPRKDPAPEPVKPPSQAFIEKLRKKGFGGPRGPLNVPTLRNSRERIENILANKPAHFNIEENPNADDTSPFHESKDAGLAALASFGKLIEEEARKQDVDPNLVKAIAFSENARGHYLGAAKVAEGLDLADSLLPMNIRPDIWGKLGSGTADFTNPRTNIRAGVTLIKRIADRLDDPTPERIATLWNSTGREHVNDFGAYVGRMFRERPWER